MFNRKILAILAKTLGIFALFGAGIFFISGFFVASAQELPTAEKVGYFVGYQLAGLSGLAFIYLVLGTLANINESAKRSE